MFSVYSIMKVFIMLIFFKVRIKIKYKNKKTFNKHKIFSYKDTISLFLGLKNYF